MFILRLCCFLFFAQFKHTQVMLLRIFKVIAIKVHVFNNLEILIDIIIA